MRYTFILIITLLLLTTGDLNPLVSAAPLTQSDREVWDSPLNLSQSGAADEPRVVIGADGVAHILWREDDAGSFYYTGMKNGVGSQPAAVELPFGTRRYSPDLKEDDATPLYNPTLIGDGNGRIHAFWTDDENSLFQSSVAASEIASYESWTPRQQLAESVLGFAATMGNETLHLSYVHNLDLPEAFAGVSYRQMSGEDEVWSEAVPLYESAYYRTEEGENVNVQLAANPSVGNKASVFAAMDNRSLEEVLYAYSADRGETWQAPAVVDRRRPEDAFESEGPSSVDIIISGGNQHLIWLAEHDAGCQLYHQWSEDDGRTWQPAAVASTTDEGCPSDYRLLNGVDDLLFLLTYWEGGAYLQAWNGEAWSESESQPILRNFVDPVTQRIVGLDCQQTMVIADNHLLVVGCGLSGANQDIWLLERPLGEESSWFPEEGPTIWSEPSSLQTSEDHLSDPLILSDSGDQLHTFWIDTVPNPEKGTNADIYYTSWNGDSWTRQVPLLHLDTPLADQLSGIFDRDNGPFLLWRDPETNTYFYSVVKSEDILLPAEWSLPQALFESEALISHPTPYLDNQGVLNVIYASPLNEGRGVYLLRTADNGGRWSAPIQVVDAAAKDWAMVDRPHLAQTANGDLHAVFTVYSLQPEPVTESLYYTRSGDDGNTWSDAELISQGDIRWSQVVGIDNQTVLIAWQEQDGDELQLWSQQSTDGGVKWERPELILDPGTIPASISLITQLPDQPYLVQVQINPDGDLQLLERFWQDNSWRTVKSYNLKAGLKIEHLLDHAAAMTGDGRLMTIFNTDITPQVELESLEDDLAAAEATGDIPENNLLFTHRSIEMSGRTISSDPVLESAQVSDSDPAVEMPGHTNSSDPASDSTQALDPVIATEEAPVPTSSLTENSNSAGFEVGETKAVDESSSIVSRLIAGILPVAVIVVIVLAVGIFKLRPKR